MNTAICQPTIRNYIHIEDSNSDCAIIIPRWPVLSYKRLVEAGRRLIPGRNTMNDIQAEFQRALALHQRGEPDAAEPIYRSILRAQPKYFNAVYALGIIYLQRKEFEQAEHQFAVAVKLGSKNSPLQNNRGNALMGLNRFDDALSSYERAISFDPNNHEAFYNRGNAFVALRRFEEALASFKQSIALFPHGAQVYNNQGNTFANLSRFGEALASFDRAIQLNSNDAQAFGNRGTALANLGRFEEAAESMRRAVSLEPKDAKLHYSHALVLNDLKRFDEAIAACDKALALDSSLDFVLSDRLLFGLRICHWDAFDEKCLSVLSGVRDGSLKATPFTLLPLPSTPEDQKKCAQAFVISKAPAVQKPLWRGERYSHDRIKVGYVSSDFRDHPTAHLIAGMIETHDRSRYAITGISTAISSEGAMRDRISSGCETFVEAGAMSDGEIAQYIRVSEIDIFVDLNGHTAGRRPGIFSARPAPVQVNYLGYPGTMGASYIDYIIADPHVIPENAISEFSEKIVYLPNSYQVNDSKRRIADQFGNRESHGLPSLGFVFACFNNSFKITPDIFDAWMRLLKAVDGSVLWLFSENLSATRNLRMEAVKRGIPAERLIFASRLPNDEHLARHKLADLFLDTLHYNAHTTASDALWAGLPVLTCAGSTFASRVAASLLHAIGLPELITHSLEDYEKLALKYATNPDMLSAIKSKLAENRSTFPLFDTTRYTRDIEVAYTRMWDLSKKGKPPQSFKVETNIAAS
jgi:protein O-GlcNAc transferase